MRRYILSCVLGFVAALGSVALIPFLAPISAFEPLLPCLVLILVASGRTKALVAAGSGGLLLQLYGFGSFDLPLLRWLVLVLILDLVLRHILTNRSLTVTIALVLSGRLLERAMTWTIGSVAYAFGAGDYPSVFASGWWHVVVWDIASVILGFLLLVFFTKRFLTLVLRSRDSSI